MIEMRIIGKHVHSNPFERFSSFCAGTHRSELFAVFANRRVTVHARCRRRNRGIRGFLHGVMAVATIHSQFACVETMAERNRLHRLIPCVGVRWGKPVPHREGDRCKFNWDDNPNHNREMIGPTRKNDRHCVTLELEVLLLGTARESSSSHAVPLSRQQLIAQHATSAIARYSDPVLHGGCDKLRVTYISHQRLSRLRNTRKCSYLSDFISA